MDKQKLHQRLTAGILLAAVSLAAYAAEKGVSSGVGRANTQPEACYAAKADARSRAPGDVTGFGACDCDVIHGNALDYWTCTVDAYWERK